MNLDIRSSDEADLCMHRLVSITPRHLCSSPGGVGRGARLDVHVASSDQDCGVESTAALISMVGAVTSSTVDRNVWSCLLDFAAFAGSVVVDLSSVHSIDHRGAALVEALHKVTTATGGRLSIHNPGWLVESVVRCCGINDRIVVCRPV